MVVCLSTFLGSSGLTGRICAELVKAKRFQGSWTLKVEYVSRWGSVGVGDCTIQDQGRSRDSGVSADLESDVTWMSWLSSVQPTQVHSHDT